MVDRSPASTGQALKQWSVGGPACRATGERGLSLAPPPASENAQIFSPTCLKVFQRGSVLWFTGLSGSGTSTLAGLLARRLQQCDTRTITLLDEYVARRLFSKNLGFLRGNRVENIRCMVLIARGLAQSGASRLSLRYPRTGMHVKLRGGSSKRRVAIRGDPRRYTIFRLYGT
ncbi:MAG: adenylyl-sulfate kinase [Acidiferrobacteraceae bacterium]